MREGRDSAVGIATRSGLEGPGIKSRWGEFLHSSRQALRPTQPPMQWVNESFPGIKRPRRGVDHPHSSGAEVKERVELYLYSPSGPSWPVLGRTLHFTFYTHTHTHTYTRMLWAIMRAIAYCYCVRTAISVKLCSHPLLLFAASHTGHSGS
jgi:hypothetical protein